MGYLQHPLQQGMPPCIPMRDGLQPAFRLAAWFIRTPGLAFITHSLLQQFSLWPLLLRLFCSLDFSLCSLSLSVSSLFVLHWAG